VQVTYGRGRVYPRRSALIYRDSSRHRYAPETIQKKKRFRTTGATTLPLPGIRLIPMWQLLLRFNRARQTPDYVTHHDDPHDSNCDQIHVAPPHPAAGARPSLRSLTCWTEVTNVPQADCESFVARPAPKLQHKSRTGVTFPQLLPSVSDAQVGSNEGLCVHCGINDAI